MKVRLWCLLLGISLISSLMPLAAKGEESELFTKEEVEKAPDNSNFKQQDVFIQEVKANQMFHQATEFVEQKKYAEAITLMEKILKIRRRLNSKDNSYLVKHIDLLGRLYSIEERYDKAEPLLIEALERKRVIYTEEHITIVKSLMQLGFLYQDQGEYSKAEPLSIEALEMSQRLHEGNHPTVAFGLSNLAGIYDNQGRYTEAESLYTQALEMSRRLHEGDHPNVVFGLNNLAEFYNNQGRYTEAEPLSIEALEMGQRLHEGDHPDVVISLNNLAGIYNDQGRYTEAEPLYTQALEMSQRLHKGDHPNVAISLNNLAGIYNNQGRYTEAEPLYTQALEMSQRLHKGDHPNVAISLSNLAKLYDNQGRYTEAEPLSIEALEMRQRLYESDHPYIFHSLINLAVVYGNKGRYTEAEPLYAQALEMSQRLYGGDHPDVVTSLGSLSWFYQLQSQYPKALNYLSQAAEIGESILSKNLIIGSEQQKKQFLNKFQNQTYAIISLHFQNIPNNKKAAELALTTILRRKGRILDVTGQALQSLRDNLDLESEKLFTQLANTQTQLANLSSRPLPEDATERRDIKAQKAELKEEIQQLEAQLSSRSAEFRQEVTPVTISAVQQAIPNHTALAEFIQYEPFDPNASDNERHGEPRYAVYVPLPDGQMQWQDLGEASVIDAQIQHFRTLLGNGGERGLNAVPIESDIETTKKVARELDELLMKPVRAMVGDATHLLLSPDSQLNTLPFAALVDEQDRYLVENYLITYLTSGRDLLRLQLNQNQDTSQPLLMANPTYSSEGVAVASADTKVDKEDSSRGRRSGELSKLEFASLPGTKVEGEAISQLVPNLKVFTEQQASENNLKQTKNPEFLHLATHGFFLPPQPEELNNDRNSGLIDNQTPVFTTAENPLLRSGLALAGFNQRDSGNEDGVLTALEVTGLNLRGTKLVVMSACETGLGDVQAGEGVYGLRRAFTLAGAQSQLMSLWSVDDDGTKDLMVEYYRRIQNGEARGEALRQVQLEMLQSEDRNHPFFWAAFIPSGSWLPLDSSL